MNQAKCCILQAMPFRNSHAFLLPHLHRSWKTRIDLTVAPVTDPPNTFKFFLTLRNILLPLWRPPFFELGHIITRYFSFSSPSLSVDDKLLSFTLKVSSSSTAWALTRYSKTLRIALMYMIIQGIHECVKFKEYYQPSELGHAPSTFLVWNVVYRLSCSDPDTPFMYYLVVLFGGIETDRSKSPNAHLTHDCNVTLIKMNGEEFVDFLISPIWTRQIARILRCTVWAVCCLEEWDTWCSSQSDCDQCMRKPSQNGNCVNPHRLRWRMVTV
ncbi:uncharacterized protein F5147DRAFT_654611 [Suillus discolor]|uniref:Uncharacterized protein n=1 Tax=Suillus discolor TaxID=1912936 RepID=A0A9P7JRZ4_9AGAM|nr:uncharacterized protein F5147DRAFT_654611 [Suillus discolor]KAG2103694.1 hypothetical protein F5147DRAFT_654611 [Suillus discolor]